jgi:hypothetical protein
VVEHNGELVDHTVTWRFEDPTEMSGSELFAEARKGSALRGVALVVAIVGLGVLALGVIALVLWQVLARRRPPVGAAVSDGAVVPAGIVVPAGVAVPAGEVVPIGEVVPAEDLVAPVAPPASKDQGPGWFVQPVEEGSETPAQPNNESA